MNELACRWQGLCWRDMFEMVEYSTSSSSHLMNQCKKSQAVVNCKMMEREKEMPRTGQFEFDDALTIAVKRAGALKGTSGFVELVFEEELPLTESRTHKS